MPDTIPDLWSENIRVDVLTPIVILRSQEGLLSKKTQGILEAKVTTTATKELVQHQLDLIAPALNRYRETLLTVTHRPERVYPVRVAAECLQSPRTELEAPDWIRRQKGGPPPGTRDANNQDELIDLLRIILRSSQVVAAIESLIARSNEAGQVASSPASNPSLAPPAQSSPPITEER
jgi:hypothetical protein